MILLVTEVLEFRTGSRVLIVEPGALMHALPPPAEHWSVQHARFENRPYDGGEWRVFLLDTGFIIHENVRSRRLTPLELLAYADQEPIGLRAEPAEQQPTMRIG